MKRHSQKGEKHFKITYPSDKGLVSRIYKELLQVSSKRHSNFFLSLSPCLPLSFFPFLPCFLPLWEGERVCAQGRGREREGDRISSRLHAASVKPDVGLELTNREIMTWAEVGFLTDWVTQAPHKLQFKTSKGIWIDRHFSKDPQMASTWKDAWNH